MDLQGLGRDDGGRRAPHRRTPPGHRVFFALQPEAADIARLHRIGQRLRRQAPGSLLSPERLHISLDLVHAGDAPPAEAMMQEAVRQARTVAMPPFTVVLNRIQSWAASQGPLVLTGDEGVIGVQLLQAKIAAARGRAPDTGFVPHMSLIWRAPLVAETGIDPVRLRVRQFVLIHSIRGESRHRVLARFPLEPQAPAYHS